MAVVKLKTSKMPKILKINMPTNFSAIDKCIDNIHNGNIVSFVDKDVVMLSKTEWDAIQETIYLCSIPNMEVSIIDGMKEPIENCVMDVGL